MIVLIPVCHYRVHYQIASGRPFSVFERLVLEAIHDGSGTLETLEACFHLHRRVITEAVVTLMQAGWVAINRNNHILVTTESGKAGIRSEGALPGNIIIQEKSSSLVGERLVGQLARGEDVRFFPKQQLKKERPFIVELRAENIPHSLDPGVLVPHIKTEEGTWIRSCQPGIVARQKADYVVAHVNLKTKVVIGLPEAWLPAIRDQIIDAAFDKQLELERSGQSNTQSRKEEEDYKSKYLPVSISTTRKESVQSHLPFSIGNTILWCHNTIIIADLGDTVEAVIGAGNWLDLDGNNTEKAMLSFHFTEPKVVASLARIAADLAGQDIKLTSGFVPLSLHGLSANLESCSIRLTNPGSSTQFEDEDTIVPDEMVNQPDRSEDKGRINVRLLFANQHKGILNKLADDAQSRFIVGTPGWGTEDETWLIPAFQKGSYPRRELHYGRNHQGEEPFEEQRQRLQKEQIDLYENKAIGTAFAIADNNHVLLTSLDWLADKQALKGTPPVLSHIGVLVSGDNMAAPLLEAMSIPDKRAKEHAAHGIYISSFQGNNLRSLSHVHWSLPEGVDAPGWHVLLGNNGSGKSTLLGALALALLGQEYADPLNNYWPTILRDENSDAEFKLTLAGDDAESILPDALTQDIKIKWSPGRTRGVTVLEHSHHSAECENIFSMSYGALRRFVGGEPVQEDGHSRIKAFTRHISLFDERYALTDLLGWLKKLDHAANREPLSKNLLDNVKALINNSELLPCGVKLEKITPDDVLFMDDQNNSYNITALSDGYRAVLTLVLDIVRNLSDHYPNTQLFDPNEKALIIAPGVVLIDEVDIHLHPSWQRVIGPWLIKHFPRIQFFVTTHSPLVCQTAVHGTVFLLPDLDDTSSETGGMIKGSQRNRLLYGNMLEVYESLAFGTRISRSDIAQEKRERLAELNAIELEGGNLSESEHAERMRLREMLQTRSGRIGRKGDDG